jgi:hypothetical protein
MMRTDLRWGFLRKRSGSRLGRTRRGLHSTVATTCQSTAHPTQCYSQLTEFYVTRFRRGGQRRVRDGRNVMRSSRDTLGVTIGVAAQPSSRGGHDDDSRCRTTCAFDGRKSMCLAPDDLGVTVGIAAAAFGQPIHREDAMRIRGAGSPAPVAGATRCIRLATRPELAGSVRLRSPPGHDASPESGTQPRRGPGD